MTACPLIKFSLALPSQQCSSQQTLITVFPPRLFSPRGAEDILMLLVSAKVTPLVCSLLIALPVIPSLKYLYLSHLGVNSHSCQDPNCYLLLCLWHKLQIFSPLLSFFSLTLLWWFFTKKKSFFNCVVKFIFFIIIPSGYDVMGKFFPLIKEFIVISFQNLFGSHFWHLDLWSLWGLHFTQTLEPPPVQKLYWFGICYFLGRVVITVKIIIVFYVPLQYITV